MARPKKNYSRDYDKRSRFKGTGAPGYEEGWLYMNLRDMAIQAIYDNGETETWSGHHRTEKDLIDAYENLLDRFNEEHKVDRVEQLIENKLLRRVLGRY